MEARKNILSFENACIMNGESTVIFDLNLSINEGDFVYITGKVGSGKTSIIRTIIAENPLGKGSGIVCGYDLAKIRNQEIPFLRRRVGVVFQDFQLLQDRDVHDNLEFVLRATGWKDNVQIERSIEDVLDAVKLVNKSHKMPYQLSGGEQQRVAIARSLLNKPEIIVADEPTGNLDAETADGIMQLLRSINADGTAIVMVTHNRDIPQRYPGRILECRDEAVYEIQNAAAIGGDESINSDESLDNEEPINGNESLGNEEPINCDE